jgi:hypothetical protein
MLAKQLQSNIPFNILTVSGLENKPAFSLHPYSSISLIDMTFKTLSKRQNGTVDQSLFSLHLIEGRVIPDWKKPFCIY